MHFSPKLYRVLLDPGWTQKERPLINRVEQTFGPPSTCASTLGPQNVVHKDRCNEKRFHVRTWRVHTVSRVICIVCSTVWRTEADYEFLPRVAAAVCQVQLIHFADYGALDRRVLGITADIAVSTTSRLSVAIFATSMAYRRNDCRSWLDLDIIGGGG